MNAQKLYRKVNDEYEVVKYFCGRCGMIYSTEELAENCCKAVTCSVCGREIPQEKGKREFYYINPIRCCYCFQKENEDKMPIVESYNGEPIYDGSQFYEDLDEYIDCFCGLEGDIPEWLELCDLIPVPKINSYNLLESLIEECCSEDNDCLYDCTEELHEFIKQWNNKQKATLYQPSGKKLLIDDKIRRQLMDIIKYDN